MNSLQEDQIEMLISAVEENPLIYDQSHSLHKNFFRRQKTWKDISEIVGADVKLCKNAWRSLRDQFAKCSKEMTYLMERPDRKIYRYYDQLMFLSGINETKERNSTYQESDEQETAILNAIDFDWDEIKETVIPTPSKKIRLCTPRPISPQEPANKSQKDTQTSTATEDDFVKQFLSDVMTEVKATNETIGPREQFFLSMASMVGTVNLTNAQTRQLQKRIYNFVVDELEEFDPDE